MPTAYRLLSYTLRTYNRQVGNDRGDLSHDWSTHDVTALLSLPRVGRTVCGIKRGQSTTAVVTGRGQIKTS